MAELSVSINGFLGTVATFAADLNLAVQLAMGRSDRRTDSRKAQATQRPRCLPNDGFAFQPVVDRIRDVAFVPATTGSPPPQNSPQQVLHDRNEPRCFGVSGRNSWDSTSSLVGTNLAPRHLRFNDWKRWLRIELLLCYVAFIGGLGTYYAWYIAPFP
jgi:hypothetical protein